MRFSASSMVPGARFALLYAVIPAMTCADEIFTMDLNTSPLTAVPGNESGPFSLAFELIQSDPTKPNQYRHDRQFLVWRRQRRRVPIKLRHLWQCERLRDRRYRYKHERPVRGF
jgi:hypothetical protein